MREDVLDQIRIDILYQRQHATAAGATTTSSADQAMDAKGFDSNAMAFVALKLDASCASADTVTVTIQKCTDTAGSNAATLVAFSAVAGDGAAKTSVVRAQAPLYNLGNYAAGTPYRYIIASVVIVDANSSGTFDICVGIVSGGYYKRPVVQAAETT